METPEQVLQYPISKEATPQQILVPELQLSRATPRSIAPISNKKRGSPNEVFMNRTL